MSVEERDGASVRTQGGHRPPSSFTKKKNTTTEVKKHLRNRVMNNQTFEQCLMCFSLYNASHIEGLKRMGSIDLTAFLIN